MLYLTNHFVAEPDIKLGFKVMDVAREAGETSPIQAGDDINAQQYPLVMRCFKNV
jgi:hypothetical protein